MGPTRQAILDFIRANPRCSYDEIMNGVYKGVRSPKTVKTHLNSIRRMTGIRLRRISVYYIEETK